MRLTLLAVGIAAVTAAILIARPGGQPTPAAIQSSLGRAVTPERVNPPYFTVEPGRVPTKPDANPLFDQRNLFADFQAAIGSSDKRTVEAGLVAWRKCARFVAMGEGDIEDWVATVMPTNLSREEWGRRAQYARASAARCAGFARQGELHEQAEALSRKAGELGSVSEALLVAIVQQATTSAPAPSLVAVSCDQVKQYVEGHPEGIRRITPAMGSAARARPSHFLNGASLQARTIGINLALCDLDPRGCDLGSDFLGSACIQAGKCEYLNEVDYWKGEISPHVWDGAQGIRGKLVAAVKVGDCQSLF